MNKNIFILGIIFLICIVILVFMKILSRYESESEISETSIKIPQNLPKDVVNLEEYFKPPSDEERIIQSGYSFVYSKSQNRWREYKPNTILSPDDILVSKGYFK
ncbi:MAG: hypothetical protein PHC34_01655 [Candidatus Gastranaerophilales bacterium]|nr:hypothetical protein [Candidatus Gastranaerophilales bacterium]